MTIKWKEEESPDGSESSKDTEADRRREEEPEESASGSQAPPRKEKDDTSAHEPSSKPSVRASLRESRKVTIVKIALAPLVFAVLLAEVLIVVQVIRGRLGIEAGIALMFGGVLTAAAGIVPLVAKLVEGITREDEARIAAGSPKKE